MRPHGRTLSNESRNCPCCYSTFQVLPDKNLTFLVDRTGPSQKIGSSGIGTKVRFVKSEEETGTSEKHVRWRFSMPILTTPLTVVVTAKGNA